MSTNDVPVIFSYGLGQAQEISSALSDFLCWIQGFKAAGGEYHGDTETLRDLNINLKAQIRKVEGK